MSDKDIVADEKRLATPPITVNCRNCGEQIYLSIDYWYHLNTGARMCRLRSNEDED